MTVAWHDRRDKRYGQPEVPLQGGHQVPKGEAPRQGGAARSTGEACKLKCALQVLSILGPPRRRAFSLQGRNSRTRIHLEQAGDELARLRKPP